MKILFDTLISLLLLAIAIPAMAHPGHLSNEAVHGLLHVEHIIPLASIAALIAIVAIRDRD
jgi:hypothetical protein